VVKKEHERTFAGKVRRALWLFIRRNFSARGLYLRFLAGRISFVDGRNNEARAIVLQIPGQTDPCYSPFNKGIARRLAAEGYTVIRCDFSGQKLNQMKRELTDRQVDAFCEQLIRRCDRLRRLHDQPLILVGKSLGGAIVTKALDRTGAAGCVVLGYPFQKEGSHWDRLSHLAHVRTPVFIIQGEDDRYGAKKLVAGLTLSESISMVWIPGAEHGFKHHVPALKEAVAGACQTILKASDPLASEAE